VFKVRKGVQERMHLKEDGRNVLEFSNRLQTQKEIGELLVGNNVTPIIILYFVFD
jgi:hypothetical protein